jgi:hypothetical protein
MSEKSESCRYFEIPPTVVFPHTDYQRGGEPWLSCSFAEYWTGLVRDELPTLTAEDEDILEVLDIKFRDAQPGERIKITAEEHTALVAYLPRNSKHPNQKQWPAQLLYDLRSYRQAITRATRTPPPAWLAAATPAKEAA